MLFCRDTNREQQFYALAGSLPRSSGISRAKTEKDHLSPKLLELFQSCFTGCASNMALEDTHRSNERIKLTFRAYIFKGEKKNKKKFPKLGPAGVPRTAREIKQCSGRGSADFSDLP